MLPHLAGNTLSSILHLTGGRFQTARLIFFYWQHVQKTSLATRNDTEEKQILKVWRIKTNKYLPETIRM